MFDAQKAAVSQMLADRGHKMTITIAARAPALNAFGPTAWVETVEFGSIPLAVCSIKAEIAAAELPGEVPEEVYFKVLVDSTLSTLMRVHTQRLSLSDGALRYEDSSGRRVMSLESPEDLPAPNEAESEGGRVDYVLRAHLTRAGERELDLLTELRGALDQAESDQTESDG